MITIFYYRLKKNLSLLKNKNFRKNEIFYRYINYFNIIIYGHFKKICEMIKSISDCIEAHTFNRNSSVKGSYPYATVKSI